MVYFVLARSNAKTMINYKNGRGKAVSEHIGIVLYDELGQFAHLRDVSVLIFSDFDRLSEPQRQLAAEVYRTVRERYPEIPVYNDPSRAMLRYRLLRTMWERGINPYNVHLLDDDLDNVKYPVFIREANEHNGPVTGFIHDRKALDIEILALRLQGYLRKNLIIVEFLDVSDGDGNYRKYSVLKLGETVFPRQLDLGTEWELKTEPWREITPAQSYVEEFEYFVTQNPHEDWINTVFEIGGIDYGRIDYGMYQGKPVVWEINLNPYYGRGLYTFSNRHPVFRDNKLQFHENLRQWFVSSGSGGTDIRLDMSSFDLCNMREKASVVRWREFRRHLKTKKKWKRPLVKMFRNSSRGVARSLQAIAPGKI